MEKITKKPRIGRPPKAPEQKASNVLRVKLTPGERADLDAAAERAGQLVSVWARELLLRAARRR